METELQLRARALSALREFGPHTMVELMARLEMPAGSISSAKLRRLLAGKVRVDGNTRGRRYSVE